MILLINYYIDKRSERQAELDRCLQLNLAHPLIVFATPCRLKIVEITHYHFPPLS
jgi:hypothetical protein